MGKLNNYKKVIIDNKSYAVCNLIYNGKNVPIVLDYNIYDKIRSLDKNWHISDNGSVVTMHKTIINGEETNKEIYLHDVVLKLNNIIPNKPVLHINKLGIDNRFDNLMLDTRTKNILKNLNKKTRTVILPTNSKIKIDDIPSFIWYMKPDTTHGDRFMVDIGGINWKTTSSKDLSLRYKLEEAKKYLRNLKKINIDLFNNHSMNGDLNKSGINNLNLFTSISQTAGFKNLNNNIYNNTDHYLKENLKNLSLHEIQLLNEFDPFY